MSTSKRDPAPKTSASFTSWKMRLLNAAGADPRIPPTYFRFLVRVIQALNEETRIAMIGDDVIADEVPGFAQQSTRNRARRALAELGYLSYEAGQGAKVTRYRISDEPVPAIMVAIEEARRRRAAEREARKQAFRDQYKPALVQGTDHLQPCKSHPPKPAPVQGVHLHSTPSPKGYREEDVTPGARASMPADAHAPVRTDLLRCMDCGDPATVEGSYQHSSALFHSCDACFDGMCFVEHRQIGGLKSSRRPAEPQLSAANDPGADYKRVRDGT